MVRRIAYLAKIAVAFAFAIGLGFVLHAFASYLYDDLAWWAVVVWVVCAFGGAFWMNWRHGYLFNDGDDETEPPR